MKAKWGVIGCGGIADRKTLPGMMQAKNSELVAVMDKNFDAALRCKEKYNAKYAFNNIEELLALDEIDVVYIATPVFCHKEQAIAAANAGKHILLEKPIGLNYSEALEIIEHCEKSNVLLSIGFMMRYHSHHQAIHDIIASGKIGEIVSMRAQFTGWAPEKDDNWRQNKKLAGGGALIDMGAHCIDLLQYISGLTIAECTGFAENQIFKYDVEDASAIILKMSNGALAFIHSCFNIPYAAAGCPLEIYGTKGKIITKGTLGQSEKGTAEILIYDNSVFCDSSANFDEQKPVRLEASFGNMYTKEIEAFSDSIINGTPVPISGRDVLLTHRVIDSIYSRCDSEKF